MSLKELEEQYLSLLDIVATSKNTHLREDTLSMYVKLSSFLARDLKSLGYKF